MPKVCHMLQFLKSSLNTLKHMKRKWTHTYKCHKMAHYRHLMCTMMWGSMIIIVIIIFIIVIIIIITPCLCLPHCFCCSHENNPPHTVVYKTTAWLPSYANITFERLLNTWIDCLRFQPYQSKWFRLLHSQFILSDSLQS